MEETIIQTVNIFQEVTVAQTPLFTKYTLDITATIPTMDLTTLTSVYVQNATKSF